MGKILVLTYSETGKFEPFGKPQEKIVVQQSLDDPYEELIIASFKELKKEVKRIKSNKKGK